MLKLIEATNVIRPDGSEAKRVVLLSETAPASLSVTGALSAQHRHGGSVCRSRG